MCPDHVQTFKKVTGPQHCLTLVAAGFALSDYSPIQGISRATL